MSIFKIGRNDPCWCGSGKKYKICHEAFDERLKDLKARRLIAHDPAELLDAPKKAKTLPKVL